MTTIVDYGIGNLRSIEKALEHVSADVRLSGRAQDILTADRLVLPGVGAFGTCMHELIARGLAEPVNEAVRRHMPLLGICVGMQMLFEVGLEDGVHQELGLLPGRVQRLKLEAYPGLKVPQIGWNQVKPTRPSPLFDGMNPVFWCYFVHSYHAVCDRECDILATTCHGLTISSAVSYSHIFGVQFHPEKSQHAGLRILRNFATLSV